MRVRNWLWLVLLVLAACSSSLPSDRRPISTPFDEIESLAVPTPQGNDRATGSTTGVAINRRVHTDEEYTFPSLIPYDGIRPIYDPVFTTADDAPFHPDELVMGVAVDGTAKAYPVTVLRFREMVNDELAGIPILVTW